MNMHSNVAPVTVRDRIETLDVLRGVAICGILLMNIPMMGLLGERYGPALPARWNADWIAWGVQSVLFEGTMRGLFTMLFGAGMLLMLRRAEGADPQVTPIDVWTRRCLALMALGVVQWAVFIWPGEILWMYGISGLFLLAFRTGRPRTLLIAAAILLTALSTIGGIDGYGKTAMLQTSVAAAEAKAAKKPLTEEQQASLKAVEEARKSLHPTPADRARLIAERTSPATLWLWSAKIWTSWNLGAIMWEGLLESVGFMLVGMALFRTRILTGGAAPATYRTMMLIGYPLGFGLRSFFLWHGSRTGYDLDVTRLDPVFSFVKGFLYEPSRLLITLGHVGLLASLFRSGALGRATPLRALGRMALTVYSLQSILTSILFYGLGMLDRFGFAALMGISALIWITTALFCLWWLKRHDMGPAETLLRAVAYGSFSRRRRAEADAVLATTPAV